MTSLGLCPNHWAQPRSQLRRSFGGAEPPPHIRRQSRSLVCRVANRYNEPMKIKVVVHDAEEGGYWAEVPAIPGCATQGETFEELLRNLYEAIEGCLSVNVEVPHSTGKDRIRIV